MIKTKDVGMEHVTPSFLPFHDLSLDLLPYHHFLLLLPLLLLLSSLQLVKALINTHFQVAHNVANVLRDV